MRPRIKVVNTESGVRVVAKKDIKEMFFSRYGVAAIKITTSGTREQIERKLQKRMRYNRAHALSHREELANLVRTEGIKTKYFAA